MAYDCPLRCCVMEPHKSPDECCGCVDEEGRVVGDCLYPKRECCETYPYEDHAENCEVGWGKTCCYKLPKGKHTSDCTSNEAVFARADPEANAAKPAKWAEYRKQHGDSPHRRWVCVTSGELTP